MDMREEICQAHMAGQFDAGCKSPSWSNAHAYFTKVEEKFKSTNSPSLPCQYHKDGAGCAWVDRPCPTKPCIPMPFLLPQQA